MSDDNGSPSLKRRRFAEAEDPFTTNRPHLDASNETPLGGGVSATAQPEIFASKTKAEVKALYQAYKTLEASLAKGSASEDDLALFKRILEASKGASESNNAWKAPPHTWLTVQQGFPA